jgi:hypothetical protein
MYAAGKGNNKSQVIKMVLFIFSLVAANPYFLFTFAPDK